jgi:serine protease inhibitor
LDCAQQVCDRSAQDGLQDWCHDRSSDSRVSARPVIRFVVGRPSFFAIRDDSTNTIPFMGAVYKPEE